ncbi:MAG: hypothetical protein U9P14_01130 [Gemmatimonadota bacterium]|nr:hypothetical protein [Gemmatimonadota bacterium]
MSLGHPAGAFYKEAVVPLYCRRRNPLIEAAIGDKAPRAEGKNIDGLFYPGNINKTRLQERSITELTRFIAKSYKNEAIF